MPMKMVPSFSGNPEVMIIALFAGRNLKESEEICERVNSVFHLRIVKSDYFSTSRTSPIAVKFNCLYIYVLKVKTISFFLKKN